MNCDEPLQAVNSFDPLTSRKRFIIALSDISALRLLPTLTGKLRNLAPNIRINNQYLDRQDTLTGLNSGKLDFCIDPPIHLDRSIRSEFLMSFRLVCAVRPGHPATQLKNFSLDDFLELSHIIVSSRTTGGVQIDTALNQLNKHRQVNIRSHAYGAVPEIVKQSDLAFCCPDDFALYHGLVALEIPLNLNRLELHLYWATHQDQNKGNKWMRELIYECHRALV